MEYLSLAGLRQDGRRCNEMRRLRIQLGLFSKVHGSAYVEQGNTKVMAVIHGPRELQNGRGEESAILSVNVLQVAFASMDRSKSAGGFKKDRTTMEYTAQVSELCNALILRHLYPKTQIDIVVEIIQNDGNCMATCINAAVLACINAGIAIRDFMIACNAGILEGQYMMGKFYLLLANERCM